LKSALAHVESVGADLQKVVAVIKIGIPASFGSIWQYNRGNEPLFLDGNIDKRRSSRRCPSPRNDKEDSADGSATGRTFARLVAA
jgi:hypothetical protein